MAVPASVKYRHCNLKNLKQIKGIGDATIKNLRKAGYKNVGQVYQDSSSAWGRLAKVEGISKKTAANLFRKINKDVVC
ncbi:unnamed protein product [marine sediment metagenome]|uniref:Helix-hairpin-helix DNA-binding motif class 1 domain-containing protein n=1 Tax=marine sediment metagenome TaxID=412755 RepID=X1BSC1_9ZZZZ